MTNNSHVLKWIEEMKELVKPDKVVWVTEGEEQIKALKAEAVATGLMEELNPEKLPGCLLHRTKPNDVARVEARTFNCTTKKEMAGPTKNWVEKDDMYARLRPLADGAM